MMLRRRFILEICLRGIERADRAYRTCWRYSADIEADKGSRYIKKMDLYRIPLFVI